MFVRFVQKAKENRRNIIQFALKYEGFWDFFDKELTKKRKCAKMLHKFILNEKERQK